MAKDLEVQITVGSTSLTMTFIENHSVMVRPDTHGKAEPATLMTVGELKSYILGLAAGRRICDYVGGPRHE